MTFITFSNNRLVKQIFLWNFNGSKPPPVLPKQKVTKEFVTHQALKIFRVQSYHKTTMSDIAHSCGLLKGSIYHYFAGKEDLMKAVIEYVHKFFKETIFIHAYNKELDAEQRMNEMIAMAKKVYLGPEGGDLMGNVGLETAHVNPEFSEPIRSFFKDYIKAFKAIYLEQFPEEEAQKLAELALAEMQGALVLSRILKKKDIFATVNKRLVNRLNNVQTSVW